MVDRSDGQLVVEVDSRQAAAGLSDIEDRMLRMTRTVASGFDKSGSAMDRFTSMVYKAAGAFAAFVTVKKVIGWFEDLISRTIEVDRVFRGFIASMSIIRGSVSAATKEYEYLFAMSNRLGVSVESSITQYHRLAAALKNVDASGELARNIFSGVSQAAVVLHSSGRQVTLIFEAIQQMASKGKLSLEELQRQLGNTLPGAVSLSARAMMQSQRYIDAGIKTTAAAEQKLRQDIQKGTINVYEFLARVANQLKIEYGGGVEYATQQFTANLARMQNSAFEFYRQISASGAMKGLSHILQEVARLFDQSSEGAKGLGASLESTFDQIANWISHLDAQDVAQFFAVIQGTILATGEILSSFFEMWRGFDGPEMKTPVLNFVQFVAGAFAGLLDVVNGAAKALAFVMVRFKQAGTDLEGVSLKMDSGAYYGAKAGNAVLPHSMGGEGRDKIIADYEARKTDHEANVKQGKDMADMALTGISDAFANGANARVNKIFDDLRAKVLAVDPKKTSKPMDVEGYVNPMSPEGLNDMIKRISANSGAPNAGKKDKSAERAFNKSVREYDRMSNAVSHWRQETGVTEKATEKLARAHDDLSAAVGKLDPKTGKLLLTQTEADKIMARLNTQYAEALDPIGYLLGQYDKQAKALKFVGDAADTYTQVLRQQEEWRDKNIEFDQKDIDNLKEKIKHQAELTRSQSAMDSILQNTTYKKRSDSDKIQALGQLSKGYTDPEGNTTKISKGETAGQLVDIFGADNMKGTQEYYDAQYEIYMDFQNKIKEAQDAGVLSEQSANAMSFENWVQYQTAKADAMQDGLNALSSLMNSHNKTAFKIGQAAAIAQVAIKTPEAVMNAYNALAGIPYVGPFLGAAAGAAVVVMGAQQISKIRSQTPPAFETGGTYRVGGGGGHDSKRITFDATPGEVIQVNTPSQARALEDLAKNRDNENRRGGVQNLNVTVVQQGRADRRTPEQNARQMRRAAMKLMETD